MDQNEIIGTNIKRLREAVGVTQEELAAFLEVSREVVSYYENGLRNVPSNIISKAAIFLGVDEYDLFEEDAELNVANVAFAFRATNLDAGDLKEIASFKKIVLNYLNIRKALNNA